MKKCVLFLTALNLTILLASCGNEAPGASQEAPELLKAVPSDAQSIGIFGRLDHAMDRLIDSTSILNRIDYGKLGRARAVIATCDLGALAPVVIVEAGRASEDTVSAALPVLSQADTLGIPHSHITIGNHNALVLTPSETALKIVSRHLASETSILDAPDFDKVVSILPSGDALVYRNRGAAKLFGGMFSGSLGAVAVSFVRDAAEWMVEADGTLQTVQPDAEKYYGNFCSSLQEAPVKLQSVLPSGALFCIDIPIASTLEYRHAYEVWLDARVALEDYNRRLGSFSRIAGKDPRTWEQEAGVREAAVVTLPEGRLNLLRVKDKSTSDGIVPNPRTGFARALYGEVFAPADSCMILSGNWILSGSREVLESYEPAAAAAGWPTKAKVIAGNDARLYIWNKDNRIKIWDSNR